MKVMEFSVEYFPLEESSNPEKSGGFLSHYS